MGARMAERLRSAVKDPGPPPYGGLPVVLVSGAAHAPGADVARRFAAGGWRVALTDPDPVKIAAVLDEEGDGFITGGFELALAGDPADAAGCRRVVDGTLDAMGRLDCLVHVVAAPAGALETLEPATVNSVVAAGICGPTFLTQAAVPYLEETFGSVVLVLQQAGDALGAAVYAANVALCRSWAAELAPRAVRVCSVAAGSGLVAAQEGGVYDVTELVWFLAQPQAAALTGVQLDAGTGLAAGARALLPTR